MYNNGIKFKQYTKMKYPGFSLNASLSGEYLIFYTCKTNVTEICM